MQISVASKRLRILRSQKTGMAALEFAFLAPALLMIAFGVIVYSIYFSAVLGVRQAASEGARAAMAALSPDERVALAKTRATQVIGSYDSLVGGRLLQVDAGPDTEGGPGVFKVTVTYDMSSSPIKPYSSYVPIPDGNIVSSVIVTNGGY